MAPVPETVVGALPPPPGVTANFDSPESIAYRVIIAAVIGPLVTIPICALRLYTKRYLLRLVGYDDYAILLATLLALGFSIITGYHTTNGLGRHIWDVPADKFRQLMKIGDISGPLFYNLSTLFTKVSLCLFYLRLSPYKSFQIATYVVMLVSIGCCLITAFGFAWICQPIAKYWDLSITTGKCINVNAFFLATGCINAATDLALLVLPVFIIKVLHLPCTRKVGIALVLMTGSFVCVVSLIRVNIIIKGMASIPTDGTWTMVVNFVWILIEMWLGIVCACLPTLYPFLRRYIPALRGGGTAAVAPFAAFKDPESEPAGPVAQAVVPQESGYYTGEISEIDLRTVREDEDEDNRQGIETVVGVSGVRPVASDKSLLSSASGFSPQS